MKNISKGNLIPSHKPLTDFYGSLVKMFIGIEQNVVVCPSKPDFGDWATTT